MEKSNEVIQTHPFIGWSINAVNSYDAPMLRLRYQAPDRFEQEGTEAGQMFWLATDIARQFTSILEAGVAKTESGDFQMNEYRRH